MEKRKFGSMRCLSSWVLRLGCIMVEVLKVDGNMSYLLRRMSGVPPIYELLINIAEEGRFLSVDQSCVNAPG